VGEEGLEFGVQAALDGGAVGDAFGEGFAAQVLAQDEAYVRQLLALEQ
jgi:hypothetical protein